LQEEEKNRKKAQVEVFPASEFPRCLCQGLEGSLPPPVALQRA